VMADEPSSLVAIGNAARLLAEAKTLDDVKAIRDLAEAARVYARAHDLGLVAEQHAADIKVSAEAKAGELLRLAAERGERATRGGDRDGGRTFQVETFDPPTLGQLGISRVQSHRWQTIASGLGDAGTRDYIDREVSAGRVPSSAGAYGMARENLGKPASRLAPLMSSDTPEWYTPTHIVAAVVAVLGAIDLDPCADPGRGIPAAAHYTADDDGLSQGWRGRIYMNPPYGRDIVAWVDKLADEYAHGNVSEAIALVPARVDTTWWRRLPHQDWLAVTGRLAFSGHENAAPFPSAVCYLGPSAVRFRSVFAPLGDGYTRWGSAA